MGQALLIPSKKKFSIASTSPALWLSGSRGVGTTGARSFAQARGEQFLGANVAGHALKDIAMSAWVYPVSSPSVQSPFIFYTGGNGATYPGMCFRQSQTNRYPMMYFATGVDGTNEYIQKTTSMPLNAWTHLFGYVDRANKVLYLYVNGVLANSESFAGNGSSFDVSSYMAIGGMSSLPSEYRYDGRLSRCGYFIGTLDHAAAAAHLYNQGNGRFWAEVTQADLIAAGKHYYNLNESSLSSAIDAIGTNDCAINGTNLLTNPGFETTGLTPWTDSSTPSSSLVLSSINPRSGTYCAALSIVASAAASMTHAAAVTSGRSYAFSVYARTESAGVTFGIDCGSSVYTSGTVANGSYSNHTGTFVAGGTSLVLKRVAGPTDHILKFDDLSLTSAQIDSAAGPREATAADLEGGYHGTLVNMDTTNAWSTDTPDGSYTATKLDSVGTAHGTMTGFADVDAAHVDGPDGSWGPAITDRGSSPAQGWLLSSVKDSRSANVPSSLNTRIFDEQYSEPASTGSRWLDSANLQRFDLAASPALGTSDFTIEFMYYPTTYAAYQSLFGFGGDAVGTQGIMCTQDTASPKIGIDMADADSRTTSVCVSPALAQYTWHHVAIVIKRSSNAEMWVDGALVSTGAISASITGSLTPSSIRRSIGAYNSTGGYPFNGAISRFRVYLNCALTAAEIAESYNGGKGRAFSELSTGLAAKVSHNWDMDGATGENEPDTVGGNTATAAGSGSISSAASVYLPAYDATLTGFTSSPRSSDVPTVLVGKCKSLVGVANAYPTTGTYTLSGMGARSVSFWIKRSSRPASNETFVAEASGTSQKGIRFIISSATGGVYPYLYNGSTDLFAHSGTSDVCDGSWHHIVMTWDGTTTASKVILYKDNVVANVSTASATNQGGASTNALQLFGVGGSGGTVGGAVLCRPQIFAGRALSAAEVATLYAGGDVTEGLTAEWRFNEPDAITVPFEHALKCDGANTAVDCGSEIIGTGGVTVSALVYADTVGETAGRIIDNGKFAIHLNSTTVIGITRDGFGTSVYTNGGFTTSAWNHISVTSDAVGHTKVFINGNAVPLTTIKTANSGTPAAGTTNLCIGNRLDQSRTFDGRIGQVRIDSGVLTQAQIRQLAQGQSPTTPTHDWRFDDPLDLPYLDGCKAIRFDGVDDYITASNGITAYPFTIGCWVRASTTGVAQGLISIWSLDNTYWYVGVGSTGNAIVVARNTTEYNAGTPMIGDNQWHYVSAVFASATDRKLYVDGNLAGTDTTSVAFAAASSVFVGRVRASVPQYYSPSDIADPRIYPTALTQAQIRQIIDGTDYLTGLTARWKFGETPRSIPSCAGGYSLTFDGSDDRLVLASVALTGAFSLSAWVKVDDLGASRNVFGNTLDTNRDGIQIDSSTGKIRLIVGGTNTVLSTNGLRIGQWQHVLVTRAATTNAMKVYIDGVNDTTGTPTQAGTLTINSVGATHSTPERFMDGNLDDCRAYTAELLQADATTLAAGGEPSTAPVARWTLDDGPQYGEPSNGDPICVWEDRSGINFTQDNTTYRPTYLQSGANGRPGITFDGVQQYLKQTGWIPNDPYGTLVAVVKHASTTGEQAYLGSADEATINYFNHFGHSATGKAYSQQKNNDTSDALYGATTIGSSAARIVAIRSDGSLIGIRVDSAQEAITVAGGANNGDWFADTPNRDSVTIGALMRSSVGSFLNGTIYELLYWPRPLSDVELRQVERKLAAQYGITLVG